MPCPDKNGFIRSFVKRVHITTFYHYCSIILRIYAYIVYTHMGDMHSGVYIYYLTTVLIT